MLRNEIYSKFENMSYEQQKQVLKQLDELKQDDKQAFDEAVEVLIEAIGNCIISIINLFK